MIENTVNLNYFEIICIFLLTFSLICGSIALLLSIFLTIEVKALKKSTHSIEYMPLDPNWASSDKEIEEFNENNKIVDENEDPPIDPDELNDVDLDKLI